MSLWNYIVIGLCVLLLAVLLVGELRRENRARLYWRITASVLLAGALAAIALPPGYMVQGRGSKEGVLLTEGYDPDSARLYLASRVLVDKPMSGGISALHILGYGLTKEECGELPGFPVIFHPSVLRSGIVSLHWQRQLLPGEVCRIQGHFYNASRAPVKLLLTGMGSSLDSAGIKLQDGDFELRTVPVQAGRAVYRFIALAGTDTLEQEPIPVEVFPGKGLKILLLAAAPDFENRFLVNWLSDRGHGVVTRTAISKEKYDHAYLNMATVAVDHLSSSLLDKFDIVIADAAELRAMGTSQYSILQQQVAEKGMGLVIREDSMSLARNGGSVGLKMQGSGEIERIRMDSSYVRLLAGEKKEYAMLWTKILHGAARHVTDTERWAFFPDQPLVNRPVRTLLYAATDGLPQGSVEGEDGTAVAVYLSQKALLPFLWEGVYWPRQAGWQSVRTPQGDRSWLYVGEEGNWLSLQQRERMEATRKWIASRVDHHSGPEGMEARRVLIAKGWFYLLFVLCSLFLWVERKI